MSPTDTERGKLLFTNTAHGPTRLGRFRAGKVGGERPAAIAAQPLKYPTRSGPFRTGLVGGERHAPGDGAAPVTHAYRLLIQY